MDRSRLARYVARNLQELARGAGWSATERDDGDDTLTEGDYTDSIDDALRTLGFVDIDGVPDASTAVETDFLTIAREVQMSALERLDNFYATVTDTMGGPVRIYRSQIKKALAEIRGSTGASRRMAQGTFGSSVLSGIFELDQ